MSSQPEDGWHGGSGSGDGQAPPARNAADDAAFPNPREPIQGAGCKIGLGRAGPAPLKKSKRIELQFPTG